MKMSLNWYSVRHNTKVLLVTVTVVFFLYSVCNLFLVNQFYIKRYIELHLQTTRPITAIRSDNKLFQVDEELDSASRMNLTELHRNNTNSSSTSAQVSPPQAFISGDPVITLDDNTQILDDAGYEDDEESDPARAHIRYVFFFAISVIVVIEVLYCILYLYVISQKRFCPMLCFSILSLATFLLHIQRHFTIEQHASNSDSYNSSSDQSHQSSSFFDHIESLDSEALLNHITYSGWLEIALSASETTLSIFYTILLFYFPGRARTRGVRGFLRLGSGSSRRAPAAARGANGGVANVEAAGNIPVANGHATAIELDSINNSIHDAEEEDDNVAQHANHRQQQPVSHADGDSNSDSSAGSNNRPIVTRREEGQDGDRRSPDQQRPTQS